MRIVIDMQGLQTDFSKNRGVGRYTKSLVKEFIDIASLKHEVFIVLNGALQQGAIEVHDEFAALLPRDNIKTWQQYLTPVSGISGNSLGRNISELIREYFIESLEPDLIWSTNLQEGWFEDAVTSVKRIKSRAVHVTTLHDVVPLIYPEKYLGDPEAHENLKSFFDSSLSIAEEDDLKSHYFEKIKHARNSDIILTVSNYSKKKIVEFLNVSSDKVFVSYNAVDKNLFFPCKNGDGVKQDPYILYVGGADEHKNIKSLLSAYDSLPKKIKDKFKIKFVGHGLSDHVTSKSVELNIESKNFIFISYVSDKELVDIYRSSSLFVYPSISEGFGIPPLEAMNCGVPIISSNAASLPEVVGDLTALFDPLDIYQLKELMLKALIDEEFRQNLVRNSREQSNKFSWRTSAKEILQIFEKYMSSVDMERKQATNLYPQLMNNLAQIRHIEKTDMTNLCRAISENGFLKTSDTSRKKLYIDISSVIQEDHGTGIQRVVREIIKGMKQIDLESFQLQIVFSYKGDQNFYRANYSNEKYTVPIKESLIDNIIDFDDGDILLFLDLHPSNAITKKTLISKLRLRGISIYFVIYDLLPLEFPKYFTDDCANEFKDWVNTTSLSDGVICISRDVRDKYLQWTASNINSTSPVFNYDYFHLGADFLISHTDKNLSKKNYSFLEKIRNEKTFLMVGTVEPRKGHKFVLEAFEKIWESRLDINLVIIGKEGWRNKSTIEKLQNHKSRWKNLFWMQGISDELLNLIYQDSTCLIAASEGEGFGLPLIEAAQFKIPIIARDIPVFREVAGNHAWYFKPTSPEDLANSIKSWLELYEQGSHPKSDLMEWLTWTQSSQQLLDIIKKNN